MKCQFEHCVYNRGLQCVSDEQEINSFGMCDTCVVVCIEKGLLEKEKERQLRELERR